MAPSSSPPGEFFASCNTSTSDSAKLEVPVPVHVGKKAEGGYFSSSSTSTTAFETTSAAGSLGTADAGRVTAPDRDGELGLAVGAGARASGLGELSGYL